MIRVLMPIGIHEQIDPRVLRRLDESMGRPNPNGDPYYEWQLHVHSIEPMDDKKSTITATRNSLRRCAGRDLVLLLDSDVLLEPWAIEVMVSYLARHPAVGLCAVSTRLRVKEEDLCTHRHVNISCALVRSEIIHLVPFRYDGSGCECANFNADVRATGWDVCYVGTKRLEEIER